PLKPHEVLRDSSDRVFNRLEALARRHNRKYAGAPAWLVAADGEVEVTTLGELASASDRGHIEYKTLVLPPFVGGLSETGLMEATSLGASDVSDDWFTDTTMSTRRRQRVWDTSVEGMRLVRALDTRPEAEDEPESNSETFRRRIWRWYELAAVGDTE